MLGKRQDWIIDSFVDHAINILKYKPLSCSSYIKLLKELINPKKGFINAQNIDNSECFKWFLVRYLHPADRNPAIIRKVCKYFGRELDF